MIRYFLLFLLLLNTANAFAQSATINFDKDWRFHLGGAMAAEDTSFDDGGWRKIELPHDWSIEDIPGTQSPFSNTAVSQVAGGFTQNGAAWYRKKFTVPAAAAGQRIVIQFDGVYMNADVWVNGKHLGNHPYGYTSFYYDISKYVKPGLVNVIAIEVKSQGPNSRWYAGAGIYRHVWLKIFSPVHISQWGQFISTPAVSASAATVNASTQLMNESSTGADLRVVTKLLNNVGIEVGMIESSLQLPAGKKQTILQHYNIQNPALWSCDKPRLYTAVTTIWQDGKPINEEKSLFGIRKISFDTANGFQLNGETVKLKGGCIHHDNGPLGAKAYDRAEERKIELLKASGYNAIRCAHNPPSVALLDACDRLGMMVIDESFDMWNYGKTSFDYHLYFKDWWQRDMESMLLRDRNHPSIILWSIGNELQERGSPEGAATAKTLAAFVKNMDTSRPVISAVNGLRPDKDPFFAALDVAGYNYSVVTYGGTSTYETDHKRVSSRIMLGTESYPLEAFGSWMEVADHAYVTGDFVWTAFDYIGEASIGWLGYPQKAGFFPWSLAFCGDIDICGWKRPQSYYRDVLWKPNQLSLFVKSPEPSFKENPLLAAYSRWNWHDVLPEWNWNGYENKPMEVNVYSSCEKAELFLNGKSLGIKSTNRSTKFMEAWSVPYAAGELKAVGYNGDEHVPVRTASLHTAGKQVKIGLIADRVRIKAGNQDLSYITVLLNDVKGNTNPKAENTVRFTVSGDAVIAGTGNGNPMSLESFQLPQRKAWKGKCLLIIKAGDKAGRIQVTATSPGLATAHIELVAE
ncbi:MAG: sugar-binding domain-containing protein [Chitinophagaceae bacterium]